MFKKIISLSILALSLFYSYDLHAHEKDTYSLINAVKLKRWIDEEKEIVLLDARTAPYDDGKRIPTAKSLPCDTSDAIIQDAIPYKDAVIVLYCSGHDCPASKILAEHLVEMEYTRVYKYPGGLADWKAKKYPISKQKK